MINIRPPLPPNVYLRRPDSAAITDISPASDPGQQLFSRARHALYRGLRALGIGPGDGVLVPEYHCGAEITAIRATGAHVIFYGLGPELEPDSAELALLLEPNVRAMHLTHFLGFPQDAVRWDSWCGERGLLLIEDAAQGWLGSRGNTPLGATGHLSITCPYKTLGLPDGAALRLTADAPTAPHGQVSLGSTELARRHAAWLTQRTGVAVPAPRRRYDAQADMALGDVDTPVAASTRWLLPRMANAAGAAEVVRRRRANYRRLLEIADPFVPRPFGALPAGAVPFALPLAVADKNQVLAGLAASGVRALNLWSVPHPELEQTEFPRSAWWRHHVLAAPVHQCLREFELRRLATALRTALEDQRPLSTAETV